MVGPSRDRRQCSRDHNSRYAFIHFVTVRSDVIFLCVVVLFARTPNLGFTRELSVKFLGALFWVNLGNLLCNAGEVYLLPICFRARREVSD